jgi:hypothetical protein
MKEYHDPGGRCTARGACLISQFDADFRNALLEFNRRSGNSCRGISDTVAREYAEEYTRMLQSRAQGIEASFPRIPPGLFEPNRNLIRAILERMGEKHFQSKIRTE